MMQKIIDDIIPWAKAITIAPKTMLYITIWKFFSYKMKYFLKEYCTDIYL